MFLLFLHTENGFDHLGQRYIDIKPWNLDAKFYNTGFQKLISRL